MEQYPDWSVLQAMDIIDKYEKSSKFSDTSETFSQRSHNEDSYVNVETSNIPKKGIRHPMAYNNKFILDENQVPVKFVQPVLSNPNFVYTLPLIHYPSTYINQVQPYFLYSHDQLMYPRYSINRPSSAENGKTSEQKIKVETPRTPNPQRRNFLSRKETAQHVNDVIGTNGRSKHAEQKSRDSHYQPIRFYHKTGRSWDADNGLPSQMSHHSMEETFDAHTRSSRLGSGRLVSALNKVNQAAVNLQKMSIDLNRNVHSIMETH